METNDLKLLADKFWTYGDTITGFQVVQVVSFLIALGSSVELHKAVVGGRPVVVVLVIIFALIYSLAITRCHKIENQLRKAAEQPEALIIACSKAKQMRIYCVWIFGILGIVAIYLQ